MHELAISLTCYFDFKFAQLWKQLPHNGAQDNVEQVYCMGAALLEAVVCDNGVGVQLCPDGDRMVGVQVLMNATRLSGTPLLNRICQAMPLSIPCLGSAVMDQE